MWTGWGRESPLIKSRHHRSPDIPRPRTAGGTWLGIVPSVDTLTGEPCLGLMQTPWGPCSKDHEKIAWPWVGAAARGTDRGFRWG